MILDERLEFADAVAIPGAAGTAPIGDVIDLQALGNSSLGGLRDIGNGQPIYWYASVDEAGAGGTDLRLELISSASDTMTSPTVHAVGPTIPLAELQAGKMMLMMSVPLEGPEYNRYLGIRAVVTGTFTDGSFSSGLTLDPHGVKAYPEGVN